MFNNIVLLLGIALIWETAGNLDWCDCGKTGNLHVKSKETGQIIVLSASNNHLGDHQRVTFSRDTKTVDWYCDGMGSWSRRSYFPDGGRTWGIMFTVEDRANCWASIQRTGRINWKAEGRNDYSWINCDIKNHDVIGSTWCMHGDKNCWKMCDDSPKKKAVPIWIKCDDYGWSKCVAGGSADRDRLEAETVVGFKEYGDTCENDTDCTGLGACVNNKCVIECTDNFDTIAIDEVESFPDAMSCEDVKDSCDESYATTDARKKERSLVLMYCCATCGVRQTYLEAVPNLEASVGAATDFKAKSGMVFANNVYIMYGAVGLFGLAAFLYYRGSRKHNPSDNAESSDYDKLELCLDEEL